MLERFIDQTSFTSQEDFIKHFKIKVPENFNFGYDVVDAITCVPPWPITIRPCRSTLHT